MFTKQQLLKLCERYEEKLKRLMKPVDYRKFINDCAIEMFKDEINNIEDGDFKDFIIEHFDEITNLEEGDLFD